MYRFTPLIVSCLSVIGVHTICVYLDDNTNMSWFTKKENIYQNPIYTGTISSVISYCILYFGFLSKSRSRGRSKSRSRGRSKSRRGRSKSRRGRSKSRSRGRSKSLSKIYI